MTDIPYTVPSTVPAECRRLWTDWTRFWDCLRRMWNRDGLDSRDRLTHWGNGVHLEHLDSVYVIWYRTGRPGRFYVADKNNAMDVQGDVAPNGRPRLLIGDLQSAIDRLIVLDVMDD